MLKFFIRVRNSVFESRDDGADYERPEDARRAGVSGALAIVTDEVHAGQSNAAVEVCVEREDGTVLLRSIVALSVSPLLIGEAPAAG